MQRLNHEKPDKRVWSGLVGMKGSASAAGDEEKVLGTNMIRTYSVHV